MRSEYVVSLVKSWGNNDRKRFQQIVGLICAEERRAKHHAVADGLQKALDEKNGLSEEDKEAALEMLEQIRPKKKVEHMMLPPVVQQFCDELIVENNKIDMLKAHGLTIRNRLLLIGPSGNGKTMFAECLANILGIPFYIVRYEALFVSFLGETIKKIAQLFKFARSKRCLLFLDEIDILAKDRGDPHDVGEAKRAVNQLLLELDTLGADTIVVGATNHPDMLDRAVWRRFPVRLSFPMPTDEHIERWVKNHEDALGERFDIDYNNVVLKLMGMSFGRLKHFTDDVKRQYLLTRPLKTHKQVMLERLVMLDQMR